MSLHEPSSNPVEKNSPYNRKKMNGRALTYEEVNRIQANGKANDDYIFVNTYNGNSDITLTQISVTITLKNGNSNTYVDDIEIPPMTTKQAIMKWLPGNVLSWKVTGARGY